MAGSKSKQKPTRITDMRSFRDLRFKKKVKPKVLSLTQLLRFLQLEPGKTASLESHKCQNLDI